jgi:hypothetical protein
MKELFPQEGAVKAVDTVSGDELELIMANARQVGGLGEFFAAHELAVNDIVLIKPLEDGRIALTPEPRPKKPDYREPKVAKQLADKVLELAPLSEAEIRAMFELPQDFELSEILAADDRLVKREGRWQPPPEPVDMAPPPEAEAPTPQEAPPETFDKADKARRVTVTPYPHGVMFPGDMGLNSEQKGADFSLYNQARETLRGFGYRVEAISHGQLLAHAEMGRRHYTALIHLHHEATRLDWAWLLARRREEEATYLAVFGAHRDLLRLQSPAEMAKATLWSWEGLARVQDLLRIVPMSPYDLEPHFQQGGLFEHGLERFEKAVARRVAERGHFSEVLARLALIKAPAIFLLEDVVEDDLPRDQALRLLELLSQAPFHLISRVDSGEFCLRYGVSEGLMNFSEYALSLRDRLPSRRSERLTADEAADEFDEFVASTEAGSRE